MYKMEGWREGRGKERGGGTSRQVKQVISQQGRGLCVWVSGPVLRMGEHVVCVRVDVGVGVHTGV